MTIAMLEIVKRIIVAGIIILFPGKIAKILSSRRRVIT